MNEDGIQLLSDVMEVLVLLSVIIAILVLWNNTRAKRAERLKDAATPSARLSSLMEKHKHD